MKEKDFLNKLKSLNEVKNENGQFYTNINVSEDNMLTYKTKRNTTEKISVSLLYEIYTNEGILDDENLNKYVAEKYYAPVKAIFRGTGICDRNNKVINSFLSDHLKQKRLLINVLLGIPILGILCYIIWYSFNTNQIGAGIGIIIFLLSTNFVFFRHLIWVKKDDFQERTYNAYFTLMLFNISILPLFNFIEDYYERNKIEVTYTAGFRAWGAEIKFSHIKVSYYDKFGNPFSLDPSIINDLSNWKQNIWYKDSENINMKYDSNFEKDSSGIIITLKNCGALLDPKLFRKAKATSFYIDAKVELLEIDTFYRAKPDSLKYHNAQFCLKVPYEESKHSVNPVLFLRKIVFFYQSFS